MMNTLELQDFLFQKGLSRTELLSYTGTYPIEYRVGVYRNHSFELTEHTIKPFLDFSQVGIEFKYSDYDDSLSFVGLDTTVDALIIWLDLSRYQDVDDSFFVERFEVLRSIYKKPVLLIDICRKLKIPQIADFFHVETDSIKDSLGIKFFDLTKEKYTGTKLSATASIEISRILGLRYLPAIFKPQLKAIVVDLDNTLYTGVLGEDGINGVYITEGHIKLQKHLKELSEQGYFVCIATKNDDKDVNELFRQRIDFPLKRDVITKIIASWSNKSDSIDEIAAFLNIHASSILFIDDNPGELGSVCLKHSGIRVIRAYEDAGLTCRVLENYPGLLKLQFTAEDQLRNNDVQANESRFELRSTLSPEDYLRSLEINLEFTIDDLNHAARVTELANKTNQFIFNYMRYRFSDIEFRMKSHKSTVITVSLKDKLSDSGIIGVCVGIDRDDYLEIEELYVSCRALGRGIDNIIVMGAIEIVCKTLNNRNVKVCFKARERNLPAEQFVKQYLDKYVASAEQFYYTIPDKLINIVIRKAEA